MYTFEQLLHQALGSQGDDDMCKAIQGCQDRVLKVQNIHKPSQTHAYMYTCTQALILTLVNDPLLILTLPEASQHQWTICIINQGEMVAFVAKSLVDCCLIFFDVCIFPVEIRL